MRKYLILIAFFIIGCAGVLNRYNYRDAQFNYTPYKIRINMHYLTGATVMFYWDCLDTLYGGFFCPEVRYEDDTGSHFLQDVILVNVCECLRSSLTFSKVLSHEYFSERLSRQRGLVKMICHKNPFHSIPSLHSRVQRLITK